MARIEVTQLGLPGAFNINVSPLIAIELVLRLNRYPKNPKNTIRNPAIAKFRKVISATYSPDPTTEINTIAKIIRHVFMLLK
ncbi:MAG: hypothetical protein QNK23_14765 [Crocinitomicaceae bacterium]|nr:hypothetical protein [Crocinitomicaceae bacterium]